MARNQNYEIYSGKTRLTLPYVDIFSFDKNEFHLNHQSFHPFAGDDYRVNPTLLNDFKINQLKLSEESSLSTFDYVKKSSIKNFFNAQRVDVPICLKKSKSTYSIVFETPLVKLINMIMRSGFKLRVYKILGENFFNFFKKLSLLYTPMKYNHWSVIFWTTDVFNFIEYAKYYNYQLQDTDKLPLKVDNSFKGVGMEFNRNLSLNLLFFEALEEYFPIFSFYVRKVDKSVRKNSRGKSGKYVIIWKYTPPYRRLYVLLRWFLKDLRFQKMKTFDKRFLKIFETFLFHPETTFLVKLRRFIHFHVFDNLKTKLMKTLKASS